MIRFLSLIFILAAQVSFGQRPIFSDEINLQYTHGISDDYIRQSFGFQVQAREIFNGNDKGWNASLNFDFINYPYKREEYSLSVLPGYRFNLLDKLALDINVGWGLCLDAYPVESSLGISGNYEIYGKLYDDFTLRYFVSEFWNVSASIRNNFRLKELRHVEYINEQSFPVFVALGMGFTFSE